MTQSNGAVWLITGASRGLGASLAAAALDGGCRVVAGARTVAAIRQRFGDRPELIAAGMDVTDEAGVAAAVAAAMARFGRIDVVVNNAAFGIVGAVEEALPDDIRALFETNVFGVLNVLRAVLPVMRAQRSGRVVNISSGGGAQGLAGYGLYCATKFALEGLSDALHAELAPLGIHVTAVQLGLTRTDFPSSMVRRPATIADYAASAGATRAASQQIRDSGSQPGDPDRAAQAILALTRLQAPPLRLPLGHDAIKLVEDKMAATRRELDQWRELAGSITG